MTASCSLDDLVDVDDEEGNARAAVDRNKEKVWRKPLVPILLLGLRKSAMDIRALIYTVLTIYKYIYI